MLWYLHLLSERSDALSPLRVFQYITFRSFGGAATAFLIAVIVGPAFIRLMQRLTIGQYVREEEAPHLYELHAVKKGTPTMGGILIIAAVLVATLLWAQPGNFYVLLTLATLCYMGVVGFWDDYTKTIRQRSRGLSARRKFVLQVVWAAALSTVLLLRPESRGHIVQFMVPFIKNPVLILPPAVVVIYAVLVVVGSSNAVNLTDGLDGLAIGCSSSVALSYLVMAYATGHYVFATYLQIPFILGAGELAVFCGCLLGAGLGFLWYNCHPAQVFMGDTGSLALGGSIGVVALLIRQELLLLIVGGVFVAEAVSVILQVGYFKATKKRIFRCAPLHHHFELKDQPWSETQVTIRFWIVSIILALLGLATLKIR